MTVRQSRLGLLITPMKFSQTRYTYLLKNDPLMSTDHRSSTPLPSTAVQISEDEELDTLRLREVNVVLRACYYDSLPGIILLSALASALSWDVGSSARQSVAIQQKQHTRVCVSMLSFLGQQRVWKATVA